MRPIFIVGSGRCGTTMLGSMLGAGAGIVTVPEFFFKRRIINFCTKYPQLDIAQINKLFTAIDTDYTFRIWATNSSLNEFLENKKNYNLREILEWYVLQYSIQHYNNHSPLYWIDHDPFSLRIIDNLVNIFPDAKFIHLVRDGRAVAASVMPLDWGGNTIVYAAHEWKSAINFGMEMEKKHGVKKIFRVKYEDILKAPVINLNAICSFLEIKFEECMLEGNGFIVPDYTKNQHKLVGAKPDSKKLEEWRTKLTKREIEIFESISKEELLTLGYSLDYLNPKPLGYLEKNKYKLIEFLKKRKNKNRIELRRQEGVKSADLYRENLNKK